MTIKRVIPNLGKPIVDKNAAERARKAAENIRVAVENERENLRNLFQESPEMVCVTSGPNHVFEFVNGAYTLSLGFNATGMTMREAQPKSVEVHGILDSVYRTGITAKLNEIPITLADRRRFFNLTYTAHRNNKGKINGILILGREVTEQVDARESLSIQKRALELTLKRAPIKDILEALVRTAESQSGNSTIGSIGLVDETGLRLIYGAAPNLSHDFFHPTESLGIGPDVGACGAAISTKKSVLSTNISIDPLWVNFRYRAAEAGIKACWSNPIISSQGTALGAFALYFKTCRGPTETEMHMVELLSRTAALIIERKNDQRDLEKARDLAEAASATKSAFLANMSHEIRTPLGAIMGFVDLIKQSKGIDPSIEKYTSIISRNSHQLLRIIDDILDLSKVEAGKMLIESVDFSLPQLLTDFILLMAPRAEESSINFKLTVVGKIPDQINSDPVRLRQILTNIVGNAIKFTEKGHVELQVSFSDPFLEFKVIDSGRGISLEQSRNLFQPFSQADASTTRKFGGTGLGLVLTKRLASALGGDFWLENSTVDKGSTFVAAVKIKLTETTKLMIPENLNTLPTVNVKTPSETHELNGMNILLVEDSPDNQTLINILLTKAGAETTICIDGKQGMQQALIGNFDVVLMDVQMPVMDGHEATTRLRAAGYKKPIVALTAHAMKEERQRSVTSGFSDFITKPIKRNVLIETLLRHGR